MIVWDKLTVTNNISAATFSISEPNVLAISSIISVPTINTEYLNTSANAYFNNATFTGNVSAATLTTGALTAQVLTVDNVTIDGETINITNPSSGNSASLNAGTLSISSIQDVSRLGRAANPITNAFIENISSTSFSTTSATTKILTVTNAATISNLSAEKVVIQNYVSKPLNDALYVDINENGDKHNAMFMYIGSNSTSVKVTINRTITASSTITNNQLYALSPTNAQGGIDSLEILIFGKTITIDRNQPRASDGWNGGLYSLDNYFTPNINTFQILGQRFLFPSESFTEYSKPNYAASFSASSSIQPTSQDSKPLYYRLLAEIFRRGYAPSAPLAGLYTYGGSAATEVRYATYNNIPDAYLENLSNLSPFSNSNLVFILN